MCGGSDFGTYQIGPDAAGREGGREEEREGGLSYQAVVEKRNGDREREREKLKKINCPKSYLRELLTLAMKTAGVGLHSWLEGPVGR